jgi:hypothetical protein
MFDWYRTAATSGGLWNHPVMLDQNGEVWIAEPTTRPFTTPGVPLGLSDELVLKAGYGDGGYGQGGYGGNWNGVD